MRTLEEAIAHAREVASEQKRRSGVCVTNDNECDKFSDCMKCAEEHEQLAKWLEKLKDYEEMNLYEPQHFTKEQSKWIKKYCINRNKQFFNKAIDDFKEKLIEYLGVENVTKYGNKDAEQQRNSYDTLMKYEIADAINDVAEQLKAGEAE